jgi:integrase
MHRPEPLTQALVNKIVPNRRTFMSDWGVKGLAIDLSPPRTITYCFRYTNTQGRQVNRRIGCARAIKLNEARMRALELRRLLWLGEPLAPVMEAPKAIQTYAAYVAGRYLPYIQLAHRGVGVELSYIKRHLLPAFGELGLAQIRRADVVGWVEGMRSKGLKPGTVNRALNLFKASMTKAVEWEVEGMTESPARSVKPLADHARVERFLSPQESHALMDAVQKSSNPMLYPVIGFLLLTGSRKSEAFNVCWDHIDADKRLWTVPLSKSGKPRHIPLSDGAMAMVERARQVVASTALSTSPYVFPNVATGGPLRDIQHCWEQARELAGLQNVRLHDLRHSYASALVNEGRSIYEVQKLLGHANVSTTQRYAHLSQDTLAQGAAAVQEHYKLGENRVPDTPRPK